MSSRLYPFKKTVTAVAGVISFNTIDIRGLVHALIVSPATATTKWKMTITNNDDVVIYRKGIVVGNWVDRRGLSLHGIYTVAFSGVTRDEAIKFRLNYEELQ